MLRSLLFFFSLKVFWDTVQGYCLLGLALLLLVMVYSAFRLRWMVLALQPEAAIGVDGDLGAAAAGGGGIGVGAAARPREVRSIRCQSFVVVIVVAFLLNERVCVWLQRRYVTRSHGFCFRG